MFKKLCLFFLVMILMTGSAFAGDTRLEAQFIIHHENTESAVTAEILFREKEILVLSGLFPSYAFSVPGNYAGLLTDSGKEKAFTPFSIPGTGSVPGNIAQIHSDPSDGIFAGDLFDFAGTVTEGTVSLQELISGLLNLKRSGDTDSGSFPNELSQAILSFPGFQELPEILIQYKDFDHGKYLILNGLSADRTVFTASFDFTVQDSVKAVFGHAEDGKNYYWVHSFSLISSEEIRVTSFLQSDPLKQGYRSIMNSAPIVKENWSFRLSGNKKSLSFTGEILPENEKKSVEISGIISADSNPVFSARIGFSGLENSYFTVYASMDPTPVNTDNLMILTLDDLSGSSDGNSFISEISANIVPFMMQLVQALPEEYRE